MFQSHGFGNLAYVAAAGKAAEGTLFPCGRILAAEALPAGHPQKKVLVSYKTAYMKLFNEEPSTFGGHAYDSFGHPRGRGHDGGDGPRERSATTSKA